MTSSPTDVVTAEQIVVRPGARRALAVLRLLVGFYFLWAFVDKIFGLGFSTAPEAAVINGGKPAQGYLTAVTAGSPFEGLFALVANPLGDWLFLLGLLGLGMSLTLGIGVKVAGIAGPLLMFFLWLSMFPPIHSGQATNPVLDNHWFLAGIFVIVMLTRAGDTWGLGRWWAGKVGESWLR